MLLGSSHPEAEALAKPLRSRAPRGGVTGDGIAGALGLAPLDAVLLNGLATGVDLLDGGNVASRGHISGYVFAATLTAAQVSGGSFKAALEAFVVGYEVASRIGAGTTLYVDLHPSGTSNTVGAAAAVARARGRSAAEIAATMALSANMTLATSWDAAIHGASVRNLYHALPNYLGMMAADLSEVGFTGGPESIEVTFGRISGEKFDSDICLDGLGTAWLADANYMKRYPNCRNFHASLDALLEVVPRLARPFDPARDRVRIGADPYACRDNREVHVETPVAARESMPVSVAMLLLLGAITPQMYRDGAHQRAEVLELARAIELAEEVARPFPFARPGWAEIEQDGVKTRYDLVEPLGNPGTPFSRDELREAFVARASAVLGPDAPGVASAMLDGDVDVPLDSVFARWMGIPAVVRA